MEFNNHKPGTLSWVDLATTDIDAAKNFYSELFGWDTVDDPMPDGSFYRMFMKNDKPVAACYQLNKEQQSQNIPPNWMIYFTVSCADTAANKCRDLGGNVIMGPMDVMEEGRMSILQDPEGGIFSAWQPGKSIGTGLKYEHGTISWAEMGSHGDKRTVPFYENMFGWAGRTQKMGETEYTTYSMGEEMTAGHYIMPETMKDIPPHWLVYFLVDNIDEMIAKAEKNGGKIVLPKTHAEGVGYFTVVIDPQGAVFGAVQGEM